CVIIRLTVDDYHRYCYVDHGWKGKNHKIPGVLHTVNPVANDNLGSAAIARRAGFRYEGRMRLGATQRGARVDQWLAGRLASDGPLTPEAIADVAATWPAETFG